MHPDIITELISHLCVAHFGTDNGWTLKIPRDEKFILAFPDIVKNHNRSWVEKELWTLSNLKQLPVAEKAKNKSLIGSSSKETPKKENKKTIEVEDDDTDIFMQVDQPEKVVPMKVEKKKRGFW